MLQKYKKNSYSHAELAENAENIISRILYFAESASIKK